ncbi:MAG: ribonuclease III [Granulosicoccaceae bacterium]
MNALQRLCAQMGLSFTDQALLREALSHRSYGTPNYERLEYLGDSLLNFVIADELHRAHSELDEGDLSRLRASLVRGSTLAEIAREYQLGDYLLMGSGELKSGGFDRDSILADVVESIIGATLRDAGFEAARALVLHLYSNRLVNLPSAETLKDSKTRLQEYLQGDGHALPVYKVIEKTGQDHNLSFTVECVSEAQKLRTTAIASSRRKAEQAAAQAMLESLST